MESIKVFHSEAGLFQTITAWWLTALEQPKDGSRRKKETESVNTQKGQENIK